MGLSRRCATARARGATRSRIHEELRKNGRIGPGEVRAVRMFRESASRARHACGALTAPAGERGTSRIAKDHGAGSRVERCAQVGEAKREIPRHASARARQGTCRENVALKLAAHRAVPGYRCGAPAKHGETPARAHSCMAAHSRVAFRLAPWLGRRTRSSKSRFTEVVVVISFHVERLPRGLSARITKRAAVGWCDGSLFARAWSRTGSSGLMA